MLLVVFDILVNRCVVVENLNLHPLERSVDAHRRADADTVVDALPNETELETQHEVAILFLGVEVARTAVLRRHIDRTVQRHIIGRIAGPFVERPTVEKHFESFSSLFRRKFENRRRRQLVYIYIAEFDGSRAGNQFDATADTDGFTRHIRIGHHGILDYFHIVFEDGDTSSTTFT